MSLSQSVSDELVERAYGTFIVAMQETGTTKQAIRAVLQTVWGDGARYRAALEAIANAEIPGVSGGPDGASRQVMAFARQALHESEPCGTCNIDTDGTRIYPDGQGAFDCPACHGTGCRQ